MWYRAALPNPRVSPDFDVIVASHAESLTDVGCVSSYEARCVVPDDPGEVVRGARPITSEDRVRMREQAIIRLLARHRAEFPARVTERPVRDRVRAAMAGWRSSRIVG